MVNVSLGIANAYCKLKSFPLMARLDKGIGFLN